jgi:hypothetical protein
MKLFSKPVFTGVALLPMLAMFTSVHAGQPQPVGPTEGRCTATGVAETSRVLGYCITGGVKKAWFRDANPTELINLKPLQANRSCDSSFLSNNVMTGTCDQLLGAVLGKVPVFWPVADPKSDPKRLMPLALDTGADVLAATLFGNAAGQSITLLGNTAVVWPFEKRGEPVQVSIRNDNCRVAAVADSNINGSTLVALNCPHVLGNPTATVATFNGSSYVMKPLKLPTAAKYCEVTGINSQAQAAGTCHYAINTSTATAAAFWSGIDAEPKTFVTTDLLATEAAYLNDQSSVIVNAITPSKAKLPIFWPASTAAAPLQIPLPQNFNTCLANALARSTNTVLMTCGSNDLAVPVTAYTWSPNGGLNSIQPAPGADSYRGTAITASALEAVGHFKASPQANSQAFFTPLP